MSDVDYSSNNGRYLHSSISVPIYHFYYL